MMRCMIMIIRILELEAWYTRRRVYPSVLWALDGSIEVEKASSWLPPRKTRRFKDVGYPGRPTEVQGDAGQTREGRDAEIRLAVTM